MGAEQKLNSDTHLRNHDWKRTIRAGFDGAEAMVRSDVVPDERHVMWALLCDAAQTSSMTYANPPRSGFPAKSAMPEAPDDVTQWQMVSAYLRGQITELPGVTARPPQPSSEQIDRAEIILDVWHRYALPHKGDRRRIKRALYLKACGVKDRKVRAVTGMTRQQIHAAKDEAMRDMWEVIRRY